MGQEIPHSHFQHQDFLNFERRLATEMLLLHDVFRERGFATDPLVAGLELEAWLVGDDMSPAPRNEEFIVRCNSPAVVPELSKFNVEFNVVPQPLTGAGLWQIEQELQQSWQHGVSVANEMGCSLMSIGILPTVEEQLLSLDTMSSMVRYRALNEQVLRLRRGRPLQLEIHGEDRLSAEHFNVMLEAATTSLQVHLQTPFDQSVRYYNASLIASPIMVAIAANSPFLFGKRLWEETRIPLFEQSVDDGAMFRRVGFGNGYAYESLEEVFLENRSCHPVLLPLVLGEPCERFPHIRLHNGTIWRWNRPLIGFDEGGIPHLRIEHRTMPSGPTLIDMAANVAFFYGLVHSLATHDTIPEAAIPFEYALSNFRSSAKHGLRTSVLWLDKNFHTIQDLVLTELLDLARTGLEDLQIDAADTDRFLNVIAGRMETGQTGARWQRAFVERYGLDMASLTRAYLEHQQQGRPVHEWDVA